MTVSENVAITKVTSFHGTRINCRYPGLEIENDAGLRKKVAIATRQMIIQTVIYPIKNGSKVFMRF
jgi:hypothetical protein